MVSFREKNGWFSRPRLKRLQDLQTDVYQRLQLLIPDQVAYYDSFASKVPGSPLLKLDILERHPYTHFLRLTYVFGEDRKRENHPDAHIRIYNDARLAEVTSFNPEQGFNRLAHPWFPPQQLLQRNWRQNKALDKWLDYLLHQGHSFTTMRPAADSKSTARLVPRKATVG